MPPRYRRLPPDALDRGGARPGATRLWLTLLGAPLFALMPIAGCALGGKLRQATHVPAAPVLEAPEVSLGGAAGGEVVPIRAPDPG